MRQHAAFCNITFSVESVLLNRIDLAIDTKLRQEQAGFRKGKGCIDQIVASRNIMEQCLEWNTPLSINFIDFRKASIACTGTPCGRVPPKMVTPVRLFNHHFECSVILDGNLSEWFPVESGVRQGCVISPIFLVAIDWIMRQTTSDKPRGIQWILFSQLEGLDLADDLVVLSCKHVHLNLLWNVQFSIRI